MKINEPMDENLNISLQQYRAKHFKVTISPVSYPLIDNEFRLLVTHNGNQSTAINMSPTEAIEVIRAISEHLYKIITQEKERG